VIRGEDLSHRRAAHISHSLCTLVRRLRRAFHLTRGRVEQASKTLLERTVVIFSLPRPSAAEVRRVGYNLPAQLAGHTP